MTGFSSNYAGLRTKKIKKVNGEVIETTEYLLNGKQVVGLKKGTDEMKFYYDAQGRVAEVDFNGTKYTYVHNLQGDVIGILDGSGNVICEYKYDAWGKPLGSVISTIGELNPFRYRGYVWDEETELYYLRSRNFRSKIQRMINSDDVVTSKSANAYAYAYYSPTRLSDNDGRLPEKTDVKVHLYGEGAHWAIEIFGVIFSFAGNGVTALRTSESSADWIIVIDDVPKDIALKGLNYVLTISRYDLVGTLDNVENLAQKFEDGIDNTPKTPSWYNYAISNGIDHYDYYEYPCAGMVYATLEIMGLIEVFEGTCGTMSSNDSEKQEQERIIHQQSSYRWASQFIRANNLNKGTYHLCLCW